MVATTFQINSSIQLGTARHRMTMPPTRGLAQMHASNFQNLSVCVVGPTSLLCTFILLHDMHTCRQSADSHVSTERAGTLIRDLSEWPPGRAGSHTSVPPLLPNTMLGQLEVFIFVRTLAPHGLVHCRHMIISPTSSPRPSFCVAQKVASLPTSQDS